MILGRLRRHEPSPPEPQPSEQERQITHGLELLREATARDVMTPRVDVVAIPAPVRFSDVTRAVRRSGHSHFPVYEGDPDRLLGVLFVKDLFHLDEAAGRGEDEDEGAGLPASLDVTGRVREPYVVPESRSALEILADMRLKRRGFAVVVDEHGGFAGVITIKGLVGELVGDLPDEFDRSASPSVVRIDASRFLVDGSCAVPEVRDETGAPIPDGEYVTLGGYLLDVLGHIPVEGEVVERDGWRYRVTRMDRRRIAKVVVEARSDNIAGGGRAPRAGGGPGADGK